MTDLRNKTVLLTGATGGFGQHMTEQLLAAGSRLILTDLDEAALHSLQARVGDTEESIIAVIAIDLSVADGCRQLAAFCDSETLAPDILINNAGIALAGRLDLVPGARWEQLMQLDLLAPMRLCSAFAPRMIERRHGHIVNISSLAGWIGAPGLSAYCAAKFGLRGFGEALAADLQEHNVRVTTVYPCFSRTPILESEQFGFAERRKVPEALISEPADVVAAILNGVQRDRAEVFPDRHARRIHYLKRFLPWTIPMLNRRMQESMVAIREGGN